MEVLIWQLLILISISQCLFPHCNAAYENFTVGDAQGWRPSVNYSKWASGKNFTLGDYLIFNYAKGFDVITTYNSTLYKTCDYMDAADDYNVWGEAGVDTMSAIPLLENRTTYFFSGANNSVYCRKEEMKFSIDVKQGDGLPPSLLASPPPPDLNTNLSSSTPTSESNLGEGNSASVTIVQLPNALPLLICSILLLTN